MSPPRREVGAPYEGASSDQRHRQAARSRASVEAARLRVRFWHQVLLLAERRQDRAYDALVERESPR
jgi:hypothetical protein